MKQNKTKEVIEMITDILFTISTALVALDVVMTQVLGLIEKLVKFFCNFN